LDSFAASYDWSEIGVTWFFDSDYNTFYAMANNTRNLFGLPFLSAKIAWGNTSDANVTLSAGGQVENVGGYFYPETAQPQFQTAEYDFWNVGTDLLPGEDGFSPANQNHLMAVSVGSSAQIAGYAKLAVANSYYTGVYGYLGQYFDQAYQINTNGTVTTSTTGVLSPYGQFFATQPGPAALVTMPDLDAGARGTCTVYCVSAVIDRSQASNMDLSFNGVDATSANNPAQIWVNNNYDRGHTVDGSDFEQDDLSPLDIGKGHLVSDCQYTANGLPAIPCTRDLEDYFRLWTPGVAALMKVLPANYTVQLTLSGNGQIRIFQAVEPNGGTNYLFDETTASNQVANSASLYVGLLTSSSPIILPIQTNFNEHFIFCGVMDGSAQIDLQILDGNQNIVADAPAYLQINEIKDMYERWTVGDRPANAPMNKPVLAGEDLSTSPPTQAFQYAPPQNPSTPYILLVHGWNMQTWEKDRYAEAAYKRLYWQGYKGRFGLFRWPTGNGFSGVISVIGDARNYDNSESNAWASATGLTNLLTQLNAEYPGHVYLMAHSMGNVVAGEALRLAGSQLVNTYVAMQGAVPAHCYDASTVNRSSSGPPDCYAAYWTNGAPCYFNGTAGAGTYVNFYNTNDFALRYWNMDQDPFKPDNSGLPFPGYYYDTPSGTHPSGFYKIIGSTDYDLYFPSSTYEIFAYADRAWSYALGAQPGVAGSFTTAKQVNLPSVWPIDTHPQINNKSYSAHVWHSAQFRSDNMSRAAFWNTVLNRMNLSP
jgi:pimeloyl-ACP methyl ester carboxylesterase